MIVSSLLQQGLFFIVFFFFNKNNTVISSLFKSRLVVMLRRSENWLVQWISALRSINFFQSISPVNIFPLHPDQMGSLPAIVFWIDDCLGFAGQF